ncbi:MAG: glycosyltransferase family 4 protein [Provencibacterium sp.]|jgi:glycosyltransferase involved in cell wall biosynthesis|nr:glycosyltransferase family 4 protein [Provencibacterium sp.]
MKIAWFTPFSAQSAIGKYSKLACEALSEEHTVAIFTPEAERYHETSLKVIPFRGTEAAVQLPSYDIAVYNLGDNSLFHSDIYDMAQAYPGVLVLHDICMLNFFNGYFLQHRGSSEEYIQKITGLYGKEACDSILTALQDAERWSRLDFLRYHCLPEIVRQAKGVVVHSHYHEEFVKSCYGGPVQVIYFPYQPSKPSPSLPGNGKRMEILTVGNVNVNKRVLPIIEAIASDSKLAKSVHYTVAGALSGEYANQLRQLIQKSRLDHAVTLEGAVSDERLGQLYDQAELLINLRKPAIEGASWSLLEQMEKGKPVIVRNAGFYGELPDDCLWKLDDRTGEVPAIREALLRALQDKKAGRDMGNRAREYVLKTFTPAHYREGWERLFNQRMFVKPVEELVESVRYELQIMGVNGEAKVLQTLAKEIDGMFARYEGLVD